MLGLRATVESVLPVEISNNETIVALKEVTKEKCSFVSLVKDLTLYSIFVPLDTNDEHLKDTRSLLEDKRWFDLWSKTRDFPESGTGDWLIVVVEPYSGTRISDDQRHPSGSCTAWPQPRFRCRLSRSNYKHGSWQNPERSHQGQKTGRLSRIAI